ncbi:MAG: ribonuclease P protein component [Alphaproteobacteria bacterium]|nr:MAG: ribonuclease P protein component [Alphaproteobacteria bacterium]
MEARPDREHAKPAAIRPLKRRSEYLAVQRAGLRVVRPGLVLQAARRRSAEGDGQAVSGSGIGVGFTVTKRTGKAVVRNRIRRRLKAAAALVLPVMGRAGVDYVLIGRRDALHRPFAGLLRDLRSAIKGVHRLLDGNGRLREDSRQKRRPAMRKGRGDGA